MVEEGCQKSTFFCYIICGRSVSTLCLALGQNHVVEVIYMVKVCDSVVMRALNFGQQQAYDVTEDLRSTDLACILNHADYCSVFKAVEPSVLSGSLLI